MEKDIANSSQEPNKAPNKGHGRGGRRLGAGRPRTDSRLYTFRAPKEMADVIDSQENKTEFIKECITTKIQEFKSSRVQEFKDSRFRFGQEPDKNPDFSRMGETIPATDVKKMTLPFFDIGIVAGFPIPLDNDEKAQDIDVLRMLCPHPESSYLIRIEGNSMIDAGIYSGDIVIVDKSNRNPAENEVAVCEFNGEYTVKHFVMRDGKGWLVPANADYPEIMVSENDDFNVWGTVTYVIHKPRE